MSAGTKASLTARESRPQNSPSQETTPELSPPTNLPTDQIAFLQRTVGNRQVGRLLNSWVSKAEKNGNGQAIGKSSFLPFVAEEINNRGERVRNSGASVQSAVVGSYLPHGAVRLRAGQGAILQRKCACGGAVDASGECEECRKKSRLGLQTKLTVNAPDDIFEREANRIADQVMAAPADSVVEWRFPRYPALLRAIEWPGGCGARQRRPNPNQWR